VSHKIFIRYTGNPHPGSEPTGNPHQFPTCSGAPQGQTGSGFGFPPGR